MDLLNDSRSLIHTGKLLRQPDSGFEWSGWTELFVLLFDNYRKLLWHISTSICSHSLVVMTKPKDRDGQMKYQVYRRVNISISLALGGFHATYLSVSLFLLTS